MKIVENPSLKAFNTFGTESRAALAFTIESEEDVLNLPTFNPATDIVLGGGSNVLLASDVPGNVFLNRIKGIDLVEDAGNEVLIEAAAGENWHGLVRWSLDQEFCGLENLSLIPGLAGAAPIQNIGAYGVELSSVLEQLTAWDWQRACWRIFSRDECQPGYRDSRFKTGEPDRFLITSIRLKLSREFRPCLDYSGLRKELASTGINPATARDVSNLIIGMRRRKLPDPAKAGNAGSFFKNPELPTDLAEELTGRYPQLPSWKGRDGLIKLSAAWMIEHCGLKGFRSGNAGVSSRHALVLVNYGSASGKEVAALSKIISKRVKEEFGLQLEPEPRIIEFDT